VNDAAVWGLGERFYLGMWNAWDDSAVAETLAASFTFSSSLGQLTAGREGWRAYRDQIRHASPDFHHDILDMLITGDRAAARLLYSGTHAGTLLSNPADWPLLRLLRRSVLHHRRRRTHRSLGPR
jgi:predicted ester cyclase